MVDFTDLNSAFGEALLKQFFEPIPVGTSPNGEKFYAQSGVSLLAQQLYREQATNIMAKVWEHIDMEVLAKKIADQIIAELARQPTLYNPNRDRDALQKRVLEIVAEQLGQRAVDQVDIHVGSKAE